MAEEREEIFTVSSSDCVLHLKEKKVAIRDSILVNIGQSISRTIFFYYKVYVIEIKKLWLLFFLVKQMSSKWVADLVGSTESSVCNVYTYYDKDFFLSFLRIRLWMHGHRSLTYFTFDIYKCKCFWLYRYNLCIQYTSPCNLKKKMEKKINKTFNNRLRLNRVNCFGKGWLLWL